MLGDIDRDRRIIAVDPYVLHSRLTIEEFLSVDQETVYIDCTLLDDLDMSLSALLNNFAVGSAVNLQTLRFVLLDHIDSVTQAQLSQFLKSALQELNSDGAFVLFGRTLPYEILYDPELEPITQIIPKLESRVVTAEGNQVNAPRQLAVFALNGGRVLIDGRPVEDWGGELPFNLFFYLIDKAMVKRQDIFDVFWPEFNSKEATNVFHVTKRKVHMKLHDVEIFKYSNGFYRISPDIDIFYDVSHFTKLAQDASVAEGDEQVALMEQAIAMVRKRFLHYSSEPWIVERRRQLEIAVSELLIDLADVKRQGDLLREALGWYIRAYAMNDAREDVVLKIMEIYMEINQPEDAINVYQKLENRLSNRYGILPGKNLRDLADEARRSLHDKDSNITDEIDFDQSDGFDDEESSE